MKGGDIIKKEEKEIIKKTVKSLEDMKVHIDKMADTNKTNMFVSNTMPFLSIAFDNLAMTLDEYIKQFKKMI